MPRKPKSLKENRAPYRAKRKRASKARAPQITLRWTDIEKSKEPILLKKDGEPVAVVVKYSDYQRWNERRQAAWRELDTLLAQVHARTQHFSADEVEADITAARQQVREQRHVSRRSG